MFIERLTEKDIIDFCNLELKALGKTEEVRNLKKFEMKEDVLVFSSEHNLTHYAKDFTCGTRFFDYNVLWNKFMYAKFGEEYKEAFKNHLVEKANKKIDETISTL